MLGPLSCHLKIQIGTCLASLPYLVVDLQNIFSCISIISYMLYDYAKIAELEVWQNFVHDT